MKKMNYRILSVLLVIAILASALGISSAVWAEGIIDIGNYPALKGFVSGTAPSVGAWSYDMKDYGEKAPMTKSDTDFKAPTVDWDVDNEKVTFNWATVSGAVSYTVNVYEGISLVKTYSNITENTYNVNHAQSGLTGGKDYEAQVIALDSSGKIISASCIRQFTAQGKPQYKYVLEDFSDETRNMAIEQYYRNTSYVSTVNSAMKLSMTSDYQFIFLKTNKQAMQNATAIVYKVSTDTPISAPLWFAFGTTADVTSSVTGEKYTLTNARNSAWVKATVHGNVTFVPVDNPTKYVNVSTSLLSNSQSAVIPKDVATSAGGYYIVVPLSLFTENIQKDIKAGILDVAGFQVLSNRSEVHISGAWQGAADNTKLAATVNINYDELGYITDTTAWLSQLQDEYDPIAADEKTSYAFEGDLGVLTADTFDASQDTYKNAEFSSFYKFQNDNTARRITFTAVSSFTNQYGANLTFTAEKSGYYDLANKLEVVNNTVVETASVNYRVFKKALDGTKTTVYPLDTATGDYYSLNVSADNLNPVGTLTAPMVYLNSGEKLVIEAYADIPAGGQLEINLGNPTVTPVSYGETYKGSSYVWSYENYFPSFVYNGGVNNDSFHQTGRWTERLLQIDSEAGTENYITFPTHDMGWGLSGKRTSPIAGVYYKTATNRTELMKFETAAGQYGVSFQYTAPISGAATLSFAAGSTFKYRVSVNGKRLHPANDSWDISASVSTALELNAGDVVILDIIKRDDDGNKTFTCFVGNAPTITMNTGNLANSVGDSTYAPLWERPYANKNYTGKFTAIEGSIWKFQTSNFPSTTTVKSYDVNYYNSKAKELYTIDDGSIPKDKDGNLVLPDSKFIFSNEQLKAYIGTEKDGVSLTFTAPELGYYDFSTSINVLSGSLDALNGAGDLSVRVQKDGKTVWPNDGTWKTVEDIKVGNSIKFEAMEFSLEPGDTIALQVYAPLLTKGDGDKAEPMVIGFGSPAVQHITEKTFTETGNTTVYRPSSFTVMEKGYSGTYIPINSRFNIKIDGKSPVSLNSDSGVMSVDANNSITYGKDGTTTLKIQKDKTATIEFVVPFDGSGTYEITTPNVSGVTYRLLKNGEEIEKSSATLPSNKQITALEGDVFTLEIKATANATVKLSEFNITLSGLHNNQNSASDKAYYASFAVPYGNDKYTGTYNETESGYWKFRLYDAATGEIKNADTYDYTNSKKLYNKNMQNVGYYFIENNNRLTADIYTYGSEKYGVALGFEAPREGIFNFRSGLSLETADAEATIMIRILQNSTDDQGKEDTKTIWPAESDSDGWYEETITAGQNINVPYAEFTVKEGDTVYFQCYAKEASTDNLRIHLSSPGFMEDNVIKIEHVDVGARVYDPDYYKPYSHFKVKGSEYITTNYVPMENRWNYEYINIDPDTGEITETMIPDYYRIGSVHEIMYKGYAGNLWLNFTSGSPKTIARYLEGIATEYTYKYVGSSKRFVAPASAEYEIIDLVPIVSSVIDGGSVRYRIIKVSAATKEQTTVWPSADALTQKWTDASGNTWEELNNKQLKSKADVMKVKLETGDELMFQMYNYASKADLDSYLVTANASLAEDAKPVVKWSADGTVSPKVVVYDYITEKSIHTTTTGFMYDYQLSPYWKIQTSDTPTGEWRDNTRFSWSYWMDSLYAYRGISPNNKWQLQNHDNLWPEDHQPRISYRFTVRQNGYLTTEGAAKFGTPYFYLDEAETKLPTAYARITFNGESLTGDWSIVSKEKPFEYSIKGLEVKEGDVLRYELMYNDGDVYVNWAPTLTINKYKDVYSSTDDIYNMLTKEMDSHFRAMDATKLFEAQNPAALALSEAIAARKAAAAERGPDYLLNADDSDGEDNSSDDITDDEPQDTESDNESEEIEPEDGEESEDDDDEVISGNSGDYREWTEEIYTPGGGYKKIRRIYTTSWWVYALIIAGCVAAVAGITVLAVVLVKKKRKKSANNKT